MKREKLTQEELEEIREIKELEAIAKKEGVDTLDLETAEVNNIEMGKCPKCGSYYLIGASECYKCHIKLDSGRKACPKCAKYNKSDADRCVNCGYVFGKKNRSIFINLFISVALVVVLIILNKLKQDEVIDVLGQVGIGVGALAIIVIAHLTLNYGRKNQLVYDQKDSNASEQMIIRFRKNRGLVFALGVLALAIIVVIIYYLV